MPRTLSAAPRGALAAVLMVVAAGCGGRVGVHGKVTLDGQPLDGGSIKFVPANGTLGPVAGASIGSGGRYDVKGGSPPVPGSYRVEISSPKKTGRQVPASSPAPPGTMLDESVEAVPARYNTKTTLERELKPGDNLLDFDLSSGGN